jgi:hypothetical protein
LSKMTARNGKMMSVQEKIFRQFDVDGSGKITIHELRAAKKALGNLMSDEQLEQLIENSDANEDGEIDYWEFCNKWRSLTGTSHLEAVQDDLVVGPVDEGKRAGLPMDLVLPTAPPDGMSKPVCALERLLKAPEAVEIRLTRQNVPIRPPGFDYPGEVRVDLRELPELQRLSAQTRYGILQVVHLDISRDRKFVQFVGDFFSQMNHLRTLRVRGCVQLTTLQGIGACTSLKYLDVSGCERLRRFGAANSKGSCNKLRFLDMDGCAALSDQEAYAMVAHSVERDPATHGPNVSTLDMLQKCTPQCKIEAECPGKHMLCRFDIEKLTSIFCSVCMSAIPAFSKVQACRTCHYYVCSHCCLKGSQVEMQIVWPSVERVRAFASKLAPKVGKVLLDSNREGVREKWKGALRAGRAAMAAMRAQTEALRAREQRRLEDIIDAIDRAEKEGLIDLPLLSDNIDVFIKYVPEKEIPCINGCGKRILVS